jgi:hypothetical protein
MKIIEIAILKAIIEKSDFNGVNTIIKFSTNNSAVVYVNKLPIATIDTLGVATVDPLLFFKSELIKNRLAIIGL